MYIEYDFKIRAEEWKRENVMLMGIPELLGNVSYYFIFSERVKLLLQTIHD